MAESEFKATQLRQLYVAMASGVLKQAEQVALAEFHAADASLLEHRIREDLKTVASYPSLEATALVDEKRKALPDDVDVANLGSTAQFAAVLKRAGTHDVADGLSFSYLEREPSPLRGSTLEPRHLDLLLEAKDGRPILCEFKRGADS